MKNNFHFKGLLSLIFMLLLFLGEVKAQDPIVRGTVTSSEDGQAIIGATLLLQGGQGSNQGTVTDVNGTYR